LKLFNWTSYRVLNLQNYQLHNLRISKTWTRNLKKISYFDATPIISHKTYYMGGNGDSSQVQVMWILDEYVLNSWFNFLSNVHIALFSWFVHFHMFESWTSGIHLSHFIKFLLALLTFEYEELRNTPKVFNFLYNIILESLPWYFVACLWGHVNLKCFDLFSHTCGNAFEFHKTLLTHSPYHALSLAMSPRLTYQDIAIFITMLWWKKPKIYLILNSMNFFQMMLVVLVV